MPAAANIGAFAAIEILDGVINMVIVRRLNFSARTNCSAERNLPHPITPPSRPKIGLAFFYISKASYSVNSYCVNFTIRNLRPPIL